MKFIRINFTFQNVCIKISALNFIIPINTKQVNKLQQILHFDICTFYVAKRVFFRYISPIEKTTLFCKNTRLISYPYKMQKVWTQTPASILLSSYYFHTATPSLIVRVSVLCLRSYHNIKVAVVIYRGFCGCFGGQGC